MWNRVGRILSLVVGAGWTTRGSVAAAPANCRLEPELEPAPIRAEPSRIWSSRHFSRLPLSRLTAAQPAQAGSAGRFFVRVPSSLCPSSPSSWLSRPSHAQPILSSLHNFLSSQVTEAFHNLQMSLAMFPAEILPAVRLLFPSRRTGMSKRLAPAP